MQTKNNPSESGQAIVLIVLAIIALLGFTALAVDGSLVYADRRWAQNAADASALAGAGAAAEYLERNYIYTVGSPWNSGTSCAGAAGSAAVQGVAAAIARATENDYNLQHETDPLAAQFGGVKVECGIAGLMPYLDVTTVVKETTDTAFAQVVFPGGLENTTTAVARVEPAIGLAYGRSIVALNPNGCSGNQNGMQFFGLRGRNNAGTLKVDGGGVWSNGCMDVDGNPTQLIVENGEADYFYTANNYALDLIQFLPDPPGGEPTLWPDEEENRILPDAYKLTSEPDCTGHTHRARDIERWYSTHQNTGLPRGLYCIDGDLSISGNGTLIGNEVTIVLVNGIMSVAGGTTVTLTPPLYETPVDQRNGGIPGLLIYALPTNRACAQRTCISLTGTSTTFYQGTILAPYEDFTIAYNGNEDNEQLLGQLIGWNVKVGGDSSTIVTYDPENTVILPSYLNMQK